MEIATIKAMFDACYEAKRIRDLLPPLPKGVTPAYIHYLDTVETLQRQGVQVRVSDISDALGLPRPGVTRTVKAMEAQGYLSKEVSPEDGRVAYVTITPAGAELSRRYNEQYFNRLAPLMQSISEEDARRTIVTINRMYRILSRRRILVDESE